MTKYTGHRSSEEGRDVKNVIGIELSGFGNSSNMVTTGYGIKIFRDRFKNIVKVNFLTIKLSKRKKIGFLWK